MTGDEWRVVEGILLLLFAVVLVIALIAKIVERTK